ncbi:hypothetical protein Dimus_015251 [Dionaea muscipula]
MPIASLNLLRLRAPLHIPAAATALTVLFLRQSSTDHRVLPIFSVHSPVHARSRKHLRHDQLDKKTLKARDAFIKNISSLTSLSPVLSPDDRPVLSSNQAVGTVASAQANFMRVIVHQEPHGTSEDGGGGTLEYAGSSGAPGVELLCVVRALLKKIRRKVLVGDKVLVGSIDWVGRRGMIENVYQRSSESIDPPIANVDHLLVVFSMDQPKVEPYMLTRFLVEAESSQIPLTLALNKCELVDEEEVAGWRSRLRSWGYAPIFCSAESKLGLNNLAFTLRDRTTVIMGPSGVGKSRLINALRSNDDPYAAQEENNLFNPIIGSKWYEEQKVGQVSARSGRGKHTTRNVSLLPMVEGGYLADTPGFNQPSLMKVTTQSLAEAFPEIQKKLKENEPEKCSFSNCRHLGEPGCLVKGDWERYPYYLQLLDEIKIREEFQLRTVGTKREGDVRYKVGNMGVIHAEPRLHPKKHRRQSRKSVNQSILDDLDDLGDDDFQDAQNHG